eukprot:157879-Ditylum_brightwellii.AAC.1
MGNYVIDASLLLAVGLSEEVWHPKDFASDKLVQKLTSIKILPMLENYACSDNIDASLEDA